MAHQSGYIARLFNFLKISDFCEEKEKLIHLCQDTSIESIELCI